MYVSRFAVCAVGHSVEIRECDAELTLGGTELEDEKGPVMIGGDLNDVAWSKTTRLFLRASGLLDVEFPDPRQAACNDDSAYSQCFMSQRQVGICWFIHCQSPALADATFPVQLSI